ncbi:MAG: hypothetical protein JNJ60_15840 [Rhodocyclaceae bacterium]|nr:hypothetical protein [Rhodocyclaceae bacterium]
MPIRLLRNFKTTAVLTLGLVGPAFGFFAGNHDCGMIGDGGYGPFDYRTHEPADIRRVERAHFPIHVENLTRGQSTAFPAGDIDYILRAFPNHHRALLAMANAEFKFKADPPPGARYAVQCWYERAILFRPDDSKAYMLYGIYLLRKNRVQEAIKVLEKGNSIGGRDANSYYNLGLAYFTVKDYDKALASAHEAYRMGFPLPGLRDKLKRVGKWVDLPPVESAPAQKPAEAAGAPDTAPAESAEPGK